MDLDIYLLSKPALGSDPFTLDFLDNGFQICGEMMKNGVEKTSLSVRTNFFESVKAAILITHDSDTELST